MGEGLYPYTKRYLGSFNNHFSTIGLVGMNEAGLNAKWLRKDMTHAETREFTKQVLLHMRERLSDYQEKYGDLYNLEATPAESTSYRLAKHDRKFYPDIITASDKNGGTPYYTNSSHLPVGYTDDIFEALDMQDELHTLYTSGTVFHSYLGEKLPSWKSAAHLVRTIAENYRLPYYSISPTYSVCKNHGYIAGEKFTCPECGEKTEVYSRITGYYRPVQNWNDGKSQEYKDRVVYAKLDGKQPLYENTECDAQETVCEQQDCVEPDRLILFTTKTCPKCRMAKMFLDNAGLQYEALLAEENSSLAASYGIKEAPTLVVIKGDSAEVIANPSNIKGYVDSLCVKA
jgi:ribonucleoside-triphosphate reductase